MLFNSGLVTAVGLWFIACSTFPLYALNPGYNFEVVTSNGQTISGLTVISIQSPQIDNSGEIIFFGGYQAGATYGGGALFTPKSVIVKTGDTVSGHVLACCGPFAVNQASGALVFVAYDQNSGAFLLFHKHGAFEPTLLAARGEKIDGLTLQRIDSVAVNPFGFVAFGGDIHRFEGQSGQRHFHPGSSAGQDGLRGR